mgnify:FL=1
MISVFIGVDFFISNDFCRICGWGAECMFPPAAGNSSHDRLDRLLVLKAGADLYHRHHAPLTYRRSPRNSRPRPDGGWLWWTVGRTCFDGVTSAWVGGHCGYSPRRNHFYSRLPVGAGGGRDGGIPRRERNVWRRRLKWRRRRVSVQ